MYVLVGDHHLHQHTPGNYLSKDDTTASCIRSPDLDPNAKKVLIRNYIIVLVLQSLRKTHGGKGFNSTPNIFDISCSRTIPLP